MKRKTAFAALALLVTVSFCLSAFTRSSYFSDFSHASLDTGGTGGTGGEDGCETRNKTYSGNSFGGTRSVSCGSCGGWRMTEPPNPYREGVRKWENVSNTYYALITDCVPDGLGSCTTLEITGINCSTSSTLPEGATETDTWEDTDTTPPTF